MTIPELNSFCRRFDMIFSETGRVNGVDVYWFIDFDNKKRYYSCEEIRSKLKENACVHSSNCCRT